ncbi:phBC6A51 family helix-turn-helix protein [Heyndrickxia ginsengihumi]|uniref:phBC6A51 family helix-turn-helix protein n=1 Tax=Heyndrickxia ginsengihumi TaxID=363870 RepID=UPI003D1F0CF0
METIDSLKERLTAQQLQAVELLVENEFAGKNKRTQDEIADEVGVSRMTLFSWRTENADFIEYFRRRADERLNAMSVMVDAKLISLIDGSQWNNGIPSVRAIDLFYRRFGLLVDRKEVVNVGESKKSTDIDEMKRQIEEMRKKRKN